MTNPCRSLVELESIERLAWVDLRTRQEFDRGHIPGALSIPVLDEEERGRVSRIYYEHGELEAKLAALEIVGPRLAQVVRRIEELVRAGPVALYCWRGGARSTILGRLLRSLGVEVHVLKGGYRAHRQSVTAFFETRVPRLVVLHGYTGSGKTRLLKALAGRRPVVDLEGLASHRGSTFGGLGLARQPAQRQFESQLAAAFLAAGPGRVLVEAESPTIGALRLPEPLCRAMREGHRIFLSVPLECRVRNLMEEYGELVLGDVEGMELAFRYLERRYPRREVDRWRQCVRAGDLEPLARELLERHYDPLYERWKERAGGTFAVTLEARDPGHALELLEAHLDALSGVSAATS